MKIQALVMVVTVSVVALAVEAKEVRSLSCNVLYNAETKGVSEAPDVYEDLDTSKLDINAVVGKSVTVTDGYLKVQAGVQVDANGKDILALNVWDAKSKVLLSKIKNTAIVNELNLFIRLPEETRARMKAKNMGDIAWAELWCSVSAAN